MNRLVNGYVYQIQVIYYPRPEMKLLPFVPHLPYTDAMIEAQWHEGVINECEDLDVMHDDDM